jgi:hypothetical protein
VKQNPFSSKGEISTLGLIATIAVSSAISMYASHLFRLQAASAHWTHDTSKQQVLFALWFLITSTCFWVITTAFFKRWVAIEGGEISKKLRSVFRFFLLSPLLSIWFVILTLMYSGAGLFDAKTSLAKKFVTAIITLLFFHLVYLGFEVVSAELKFTKSFSFVPMKKNEEHVVPGAWTPSESMYVHLFPYLSPLTKLSLSYYTDYRRSEAILKQAQSGDGCTERFEISGVGVDDCFFALYRKHDEAHPFSTPLFGFLYETKYRQSITSIPKPNSLEPFARTATTVSNLLWFLRPGIARGRELAAHPKGLLPYLASPELCLLEIGQELQHQFLIARVLPMITEPLSQFDQIEKGLIENSTPEQGEQIAAWLQSMRDEVKQLKAN